MSYEAYNPGTVWGRSKKNASKIVWPVFWSVLAMAAVGVSVGFGINEATNDYAHLDYDEAIYYSKIDMVEEFGWRTLLGRPNPPEPIAIKPSALGTKPAWAVQYKIESTDRLVCVYIWDDSQDGSKNYRDNYHVREGRCE